MTAKSNFTKKLRILDKAVMEKTQQKELKVFVVRSKEQERDICNEFRDKDDVNAVLIRCY